MSEAISVQCPKCLAKLKLKNRSAVGKRVPCPKCKTAFVVESPAESDDMEFMNLAEPDEFGSLGAADSEEISERAPATGGRSSKKKVPPKKKSNSGNWQKSALVGGIVIMILGLLGGIGFFVAPWIGGLLAGNKIDLEWLPPECDVVVRVRVADVWNSSFGKALATGAKAPILPNIKEMIGLEPQEIRTLTIGAAGFVTMATNGAAPGMGPNPRRGGMPDVPRSGGATPRNLMVLRMMQSFEPKQMEAKLRGTRTVPYQKYNLVYLGGTTFIGQVCIFPDNSTIVLGSEAEVKAAIDRQGKAERRSDLDYIESSRHVVIVLAPKDPAAFDVLTAPSPFRPAALASIDAALKGKVNGYCLGLSIDEANLDLSIAANFKTPEAAKEGVAELNKALQEVKTRFSLTRSNAPPLLSELVVTVDQVLNSVKVESKEGVMEATAKIPVSVKNVFDKLPQFMTMAMMGGMGGGGQGAAGAIGQPDFGGPQRTTPDKSSPGQVNADPVAAAQEAATLEKCKNNLKLLGMALHNYHAAITTFPGSAIRDGSGKPLLSWRVALLPYLGNAELYNEFHLTEPWDSTHNKQLIARMPEVFACTEGKAAPGMTSYLAVVGHGSVFEEGRVRKIQDVTDGTSNTILLVEADDSRAVTWTRPDDYIYEPANPMNGLVGHHVGGFLALTCDGIVHFLSAAFDPKLLVALFTCASGEAIPPGTLP